jgi:UDP-N-acetylglucosamine acyltransferase
MSGGRQVIHPQAIVSPQAELATDVSVGPFTLIGPDVRIGPSTIIGAHVVINGPTTIGAKNRIFQFASIGEGPEDTNHRDEPTRLEIGDRNVFRESCTINRGTTPGRGVTHIGNDNLFLAYTHIAHDCIVGNNTVFARAVLGCHVEIGDWVGLGGVTAVEQRTKIGAHAFLAGGAIVRDDVPPYLMAAGNPAVAYAVNTEGLKRRGFTEEQIRNIRKGFRILYHSDLKLMDASEKLQPLAATQPEIQALVEFIGRSTLASCAEDQDPDFGACRQGRGRGPRAQAG